AFPLRRPGPPESEVTKSVLHRADQLQPREERVTWAYHGRAVHSYTWPKSASGPRGDLRPGRDIPRPSESSCAQIRSYGGVDCGKRAQFSRLLARPFFRMEAITVAAGVCHVRHAIGMPRARTTPSVPCFPARAPQTVGGSRKQRSPRPPRDCCDFVQLS